MERLKAYVCKKPNNKGYYISLSWFEGKEHKRKTITCPPSVILKKDAEDFKEICIKEQKAYILKHENRHLLINVIDSNISKNQADKSIKDNTRLKYRNILNKFKTYIEQFDADMDLEDLSTIHVNEYFRYLVEFGGLSSIETLKSHKACLYKFVSPLFQDINISKLAKQFKLSSGTPCRRYFTEEEIVKLDEYISNHYPYLSPVFKVTLILGLRRSETIGLLWSNIDFENNIVYIKHTRVKGDQTIIDEDTVKARGSLRSYPLEPILPIISSCKEYQQSNNLYNPSGHVFLNSLNEPFNPDYTSNLVKQAIRNCGLPDELSFKSLRSTVACKLLSAGYSDSAIIKYMGHMDIKCTRQFYMDATMQLKNEISSLTSSLVAK